MRPSSTHKATRLLLALALLMNCGASPGAEVNDGSTVVLTFIEVRVETRGHAGDVLRQHATALRDRQSAAGQVTLLQEISRPERFAALQREPLSTSTQDAPHPRDLTAGLTDDLTAPPDQRLNHEFDAVEAAGRGAQFDERAKLYVVTHVDIAAADRSQVETALHKLAATARQSDGNLGFEILQQINHSNHFNLISAWLGESLLRTFEASAGSREFRRTIAPLLGSPYDERLLRRID